MKTSFIISISLFLIAVNALHIPANVAMERREAMAPDQAGSYATLFRRGGKPKGPKGPKEKIVAITEEERKTAANNIFQGMKDHILHGKDAKGKDEAAGDGRHTLTAWCKANPKASGTCSTETHLCHDGGANKSLWDDRPGKHTHQDIEDHCKTAILNHTKHPRPGSEGQAVKTAAGHYICIKYTSGKNNGGPGTCHHAGVNPLGEKAADGDSCTHTGNAPPKGHGQDFHCSEQGYV